MNWKATGWFLLAVGLATAGAASRWAVSARRTFDDCALGELFREVQGGVTLSDCVDNANVGWIVAGVGGGVAVVGVALLVGSISWGVSVTRGGGDR